MLSNSAFEHGSILKLLNFLLNFVVSQKGVQLSILFVHMHFLDNK